MKKQVLILEVILIFAGLSGCEREKNIKNPFENATVLDCNNLRVRKVEIAEINGSRIFQVSVENTCKACNTSILPVYDQFYMIDKFTNDTIAYTECFCHSAPLNKTINKYNLLKSVDQIPDLNRIRFSMPFTCTKILYRP